MSSEGPFGRRGGEEPPPSPAPVRAPEPEPALEPLVPGPPKPPARASTFTWLLGVALVLGLAYVTLNTIATDAPGSRGVPEGRTLPVFSTALVTSERRCRDGDGDLAECDANVEAGACRFRAPDLLTSCALAERGPVALAFTASRSERCEEQIDVMERLRPRFPEVAFAVVAVRGERAELRRTVRERGWGMPVGTDRDGAISNRYAVAVCPTITFAGRDGKVASTSYTFLDEAALARRLRELGG